MKPASPATDHRGMLVPGTQVVRRGMPDETARLHLGARRGGGVAAGGAWAAVSDAGDRSAGARPFQSPFEIGPVGWQPRGAFFHVADCTRSLATASAIRGTRPVQSWPRRENTHT
jgi:hypothetical protein